MHTTYTSGAARRNDIHDGAELFAVDVINRKHAAAGRINPILDYFRDDTYQGDPDLYHHASEWLFQLSRHWAEWQSPRIGTFPHYVQSYTGPATREDAEASGEDRAYWYIMDALDAHADNGDRVQDLIVHATAVIGRLYNMSAEDGE